MKVFRLALAVILVPFLATTAWAGSSPKDLLARAHDEYNRRDYEGAIRDFTEYMGVKPRDADAYYGRGVSYAGKGDHAHAIEDLSEAILLNPKNGKAFL